MDQYNQPHEPHKEPEKETAGAHFGRGFVAGGIIILLLLVTIQPLRDAVLPDDGADLDRVDEAAAIIEGTYFREADETQLEDSSIAGMVRDLKKENKDKFSHYFDAETYDDFSAISDGQFTGVGMTVTEVDRGLRVARVFDGSPAKEAGIETGDVITSVDGENVAGEDSTAIAAKIKGEKGTEVTLGVIDGGKGKPEDLTMTRDEVRVPAVEGEMKQEGGKKIAYVIFSTFSRGAHGELRSEIERLYEKGAEGLVLDLRGNGGGLLQEAVLATSLFLEEGTVVSTEGRNRPEQVFEAVGGAIEQKPTVVLINGDTASAAEILSAAIQQNDLGTLVGITTFGKGTFQEVIELDGGGALDLTAGEYLTSDGSSILNKGVEPDVEVKDKDLTDGDDQLDRGLEIVADETSG